MEGFSVEGGLSSVVVVWGARSVVVVEGVAASWVLWMRLQYLERTAVRKRIYQGGGNGNGAGRLALLLWHSPSS